MNETDAMIDAVSPSERSILYPPADCAMFLQIYRSERVMSRALRPSNEAHEHKLLYVVALVPPVGPSRETAH